MRRRRAERTFPFVGIFSRAGRITASAVVGVVALLLTSCAAGPGAVPSGTIAPTVQVSGRAVPYAGLQRWSVASVPSRASTRLTVFAVGSDTGGGPCGPPILRLRAEESATSVRIFVMGYQRPSGEATACPAIGYGPSAQPVRLRRPIGDRTVIDASTGKRHALLVGSDYPGLVAVPSGFVRAPLSDGWGNHATTTAWSDHGELALWLVTSTPAASRESGPYGAIVRQLDIRGTPATVYRTGDGRSGQMTVAWTPNHRQTITLRLDNTERTRWTVDQAITTARAVTGYRTEDTGRLPQPTTPGTAAASCNSADGPVRHSPNMFKSSGVYVGVSCQGEGRVTVSLRGTTYPFRCTSKLSTQVVTSTGPPNDTFSLDVTASDGVRWAVTLARASLDGS